MGLKWNNLKMYGKILTLSAFYFVYLILIILQIADNHLSANTKDSDMLCMLAYLLAYATTGDCLSAFFI
jgi:hypothetical protein